MSDCVIPVHSGDPVSLEQMLVCRDERAARQQLFLRQYARPLLSLTVVMPGAVKDSPAVRLIYSAALDAVELAFSNQGWGVLQHVRQYAVTGPEAVFVLDVDAAALKRCMTELEDRHPLGRLWDLDVLTADHRGLSRQSLGLPPRTCLICDAPAHACSRSRAHPLPELLQAVEAHVERYCRTA